MTVIYAFFFKEEEFYISPLRIILDFDMSSLHFDHVKELSYFNFVLRDVL